ncbi:hypothetical protein [Ruegeria sp. HKCCA4812]|uniref:hypothetical protein n=1 Tax=Ruegeria sp. HKCCA4812 TaxID=2682993 RepID=UPI001488ADC4|nr:hypothetical protein [Ruegeria sp. HKCCA4812]
MAGLFGDMKPKTANLLQGLGLGITQLAAGRAPDLSPIYAQVQQQEQQQAMQEAIGPALESMDPKMRRVLAAMPPHLASQYIMKLMQPQTPAKGVVINGRLVNPMTGDVIADYSDQGAQGWEVIPKEEAAAMGLDATKTWQRGVSGANTGKISQVGGGGVTVNMGDNGVDFGDPGPGLVWQRGQNGEILTDERGAPIAIPYQGGPVWQKQQAAAQEADVAAEQAEIAERTKETANSIVLDEISIAKDLIAGESTFSPATGITGGLASNIDSTRAGALKNRLTTIKANIGFDKLQAMRDASPTGGALGQVSEFENRLLQAVFGSLEQSQKAEDILYNLDRLESIYNRVVNEGIPENEARELTRQIEMEGFTQKEEGATSLDFSKMSADELASVNIENLSVEQQEAMLRRFEELENGQ